MPFTACLKNLPPECKQAHLKGPTGLFKDLDVKSVKMFPDTFKSGRAYAYASFTNEDSLEKAINMSGAKVCGLQVKITVATEKQNDAPKPGSDSAKHSHSEDLLQKFKNLNAKKKPSSSKHCEQCFGAHHKNCPWETTRTVSFEDFWNRFSSNNGQLRREWNGKFKISVAPSFHNSHPPPTLTGEPTCDYYVYGCDVSTLITNDTLADFVIPEDDDDINRRISESAVNGHSSELWGLSPEDTERVLQRRAKCLRRERKLLEILRSGLGAMDFNKDFDVKLSVGLQDYHDFDNACAVLVGNMDQLESLCRTRDTQNAARDTVDQLFAFPLKSLCGDETSVTSAMMECAHVTEKTKLDFVIKTSVVKRVEWSASKKVFAKMPKEQYDYDFLDNDFIKKSGRVLGMLVGRQLDTRKNTGQFCVGGGKRNLGETPLECALRECNEEYSISTTPASVLGGVQKQGDKWLVVRHERTTRCYMSCFLVLYVSNNVGQLKKHKI